MKELLDLKPSCNLCLLGTRIRDKDSGDRVTWELYRHFGGVSMSSKITMNMTGLDTQEIIDQLMKVERLPLQRLESKKAAVAEKRAAWNAIKTKVDSVISKISALTTKGIYSAKTTKVSELGVVSGSASESAAVGRYDVEVLALARSHVLQSRVFSEGPDAPLEISGSLTLTLGDSDPFSIDVDDTDTLNSIAEKINQSGAGIKASVLQVRPNEYSLVLTGESTGKEISVAEVLEGGAFEMSQVVSASKASFKINGVTFERDSNTVSDAIEGLTLNLLKTGATSVSVAYNDDALVNGVKSFVDEYNSLIDLTSRYNFWDNDTKASGLLFGDPLLQRLLSEIQSTLFASINLPGFRFVGQVGISTGAIGAFSRDGKITLDESKLREALSNDRDSVASLFTEGSSGSDGVFKKLESTLQMYTSYNGFLPLKDAQFESENKDISRQIDSLEKRLDMKLAGLQKKFTTLETYLAKMETQSMWLSQQMLSMFSV